MGSPTDEARGAPSGEPAARPVPAAWFAPWVGFGLLGVAVIFLVIAARPLLLPVVVAAMFTLVLSEPVRRLRAAGIPESVGAGVVVAASLAVLVLFGSALANPAAEWWNRAPDTVRELVDSLDRIRGEVLSRMTRPRAVAVDPPPAASAAAPRKGRAAAADPKPDPKPDALGAQLASESLSVGRALLGQMLSFTLSAVSTVILLYFLLASEHWLLSRTVEAVPRRRVRALILGGIRQAQREIGLFLGTQAIINLGLGLATGIAVAWIGLPDPVLWGTVVAILNFVPYLGPLLVAAMLLLAGTMQFGIEPALFAPPAAFLLLHGIEANFISPYVIGHRLRLAPVSVFLSVMLWGWMWGIAGALIAVPLLLALRTVCKRTRRFRRACVYLERDNGEAPSLRSLLKRRAAT